MPMPGDQHRDSHATTNPFETKIPRITEYTAVELAALQSRLDKQLGPEYLSSRPGAGGSKVHYIAAEKVINLANEVFGFNGWSSQIQNVQVDFVDENPTTGRITLGLSTIVRVILKDGTFHEDIGYGAIENCKGKAPAFEKAKKEAVTDALKRTLRNFGNVLGNCLYDKDYLAKITKVKSAPSRWDEENLHRHPDFAPLKRETTNESVPEQQPPRPQTESRTTEFTDIDDEFGVDILDEVDMNTTHPDEVVLPAYSVAQPPKPISAPPINGSTAQVRPDLDNKRYPQGPPNRNAATTNQAPLTAQDHQTQHPPAEFITSRAAEALTSQNQPPVNIRNLPRFNPNADSPSIRKTSGIDHSTSAPVRRDLKQPVQPPGGGATPSHPAGPANAISNAAKVVTTNHVNGSDNLPRRIGAPGGGVPSPHSNRNSYKPPTMTAAGVKRSLTPTSVGENGSTNRPALADVSNVPGISAAAAGGGASGEESKRSKMSDA